MHWILGYNSGYLNSMLGLSPCPKSIWIALQFAIKVLGKSARSEIFLRQKRRSWIEPTYNQVCCVYHYISYFLIRMNHLVWLKTILVTFFESDESEICTWIVGLQVRHSRRVSNGKALIALRFSWVVCTHMYGKEVNYNIQPRFIYQHFEIWTTCNCTWNYIFQSMIIYVWTYSNISNVYIYISLHITNHNHIYIYIRANLGEANSYFPRSKGTRWRCVTWKMSLCPLGVALGFPENTVAGGEKLRSWDPS